MMPERTRASMRLLTLIALLATALLVAACGGSDDEDSGGDQAGTTTQEQTGTTTDAEGSGTGTDAEEPAGSEDGGGGGDTGSGEDGGDEDEEQAAAAVNALYEALGDGDAEAACSVMTEQMQNQVSQGAAAGGDKDATCAETFGKFLDTAGKSGGLTQVSKARVTKVEVKGDNATATVKFGEQSGQVPVVKQDGEWKVGTLGAAGGTRRQGSSGE